METPIRFRSSYEKISRREHWLGHVVLTLTEAIIQAYYSYLWNKHASSCFKLLHYNTSFRFLLNTVTIQKKKRTIVVFALMWRRRNLFVQSYGHVKRTLEQTKKLLRFFFRLVCVCVVLVGKLSKGLCFHVLQLGEAPLLTFFRSLLSYSFPLSVFFLDLGIRGVVATGVTRFHALLDRVEDSVHCRGRWLPRSAKIRWRQVLKAIHGWCREDRSNCRDGKGEERMDLHDRIYTSF